MRLSSLALALVLVHLATAQSPEQFAVASIHTSTRPGPTTWNEPTDATFTATNISLRLLLQMAFEVEENQLANDSLCGDDHYDISAQPNSGPLTATRLKTMLAALLADRFALVTHRETRSTNGYALVPARTGPKLQPADSSLPNQAAILRGRLIARGTPMPVLASMLSRPIAAPIIDKTNLQGTFDIDLSFAPDDNPDSGQPSIFTAVQEQLGLKLESQRVPLNMLVIDRCQRVPTEN